ncbi:hypothetical protein K9M74_05320 [Candidatus Woesearchaeota archaeon]|nr:hypothetical protein [Candidatus Woesearchaeota archaeon]
MENENKAKKEIVEISKEELQKDIELVSGFVNKATSKDATESEKKVADLLVKYSSIMTSLLESEIILGENEHNATKIYEGGQDVFKLECPHCGNVHKCPVDFRSFAEDLTLEEEDKVACPKCNKDLGVKLRYSVYTSS